MKTGFDWHIEGEGDPATRPPARRPHARLLWVGLLVLAAAAALLLRQLSVQQAELEQGARQEVETAFALFSGALAAEDEELFDLSLRGADLDWRRTQKQLWQEGLLWNRAAVGLAADPSTRIVEQIEISPDLSRAQLRFQEAYLPFAKPGPSSSIQLQQSLFFTRSNGAWSVAPPGDEFWGDTARLESGRLVVTYPQRDTAVVERLANDLEAVLASWCEGTDLAQPLPASCSSANVSLHFSTSPQALLQLASGSAPSALEHLPAELPAPSLLGLPRDEASYTAVADAYTALFLQQLQNSAPLLGRLPEQAIHALCFAFPQRGQRLFRYDFATAQWAEELPGRVWRELVVQADDSLLLLDAANNAYYPGEGGVTVVFQGTPAVDGVEAIGWTGARTSPQLVFQGRATASTAPRYAWLDPATCGGGHCRLDPLDGFPTASPDGAHTLLQDGSVVYLGDGAGKAIEGLGKGFSPFWLDEQHFGFVRFKQLASGRMTTEIVSRRNDAGELKVVLDGDDLARATGMPLEGDLFVDYVTSRPGVPGELLVSATGIRGAAGEYFIFTAPAPAEAREAQPRLQVRRTGAPGGLSAAVTPTGLPPFLASADGRWLAMTELLGHHKETWTILIHDLQTGTTRQVADSVPAMPGNFPLLDWSIDGKWLLVADREMLRLLAPEDGQELLVPHAFDACTAVVWSNQ